MTSQSCADSLGTEEGPRTLLTVDYGPGGGD